jgi:hypothetical protein
MCLQLARDEPCCMHAGALTAGCPLRADWGLFELWVEGQKGDSIGAVAHLIAKSTRGLPAGVHIQYKGQMLDDDCNLSDYGIIVETPLIALLFKGNGKTIFTCASASSVLQHASCSLACAPGTPQWLPAS